MNRRTKGLLLPIAESQFGLFSVSQASAAGVSRGCLYRGCKAGELRSVLRGVYAFAGRSASRWEVHLAVGLAVGDAGALSHGSAAAIHGFDLSSDRPEVTLIRGQSVRYLGGAVRHWNNVPREDLVRKRGVLVTSPTRTLLDLAPRLGTEMMQRVLDEGLISRRWSIVEVSNSLARTPANFPSRRDIERAVTLRAESSVADSMLEARLFPVVCGIGGFGPAEVHHQVAAFGSLYIVDVAWPHLRVAVEIAGRAHRVASRTSFDRERRKFNALAAAGWQVAHVTSAMSEDEVVRDVRRLLARAASAGVPGE